jgi:hypothetical protein
MLKKLIVILLICKCSILCAQTIKTDVLVIGGNASGIATAIQCAHSKVKTILAETETNPDDAKTTGMVTIETGRNIPSGTWGEFRKQVRDFYKNTPGYDTAQNAALRFEPNIGMSILHKMTDTLKNLTIYLKAGLASIKKDDDRWDVSITQNGKTMLIKARVVVDATAKGEVAEKAGAKFLNGYDNRINNVSSNLYRTSITTGEAMPDQHYNDREAPKSNYPPFPAYCIPMNAVVVREADNILVTEKVLPSDKNMQYLPLQLTLGQGAGAIAAYCAFFKTATKNLKVRIIQSELLDFKGYLLPFNDVTIEDPDWRAVQQVCETGLLKGIQQVTGNTAFFLFRPDSLVSTAEIKPVLTEIYTRAFLWFNNEKPGEKFTIGNTLSFISDYTLTDPQLLRATISRAWKTQYKFKLDFDLNRQITRREFTVLANRFLNPFARTVDLSGRLVN